MTERVSDATLEVLIAYYESEYYRVRNLYSPDIEVTMPPQLLLAREVHELRQLARDVAAKGPDLDDLGEHGNRCRDCEREAVWRRWLLQPEFHAETCPYRRAVELTQEVPTRPLDNGISRSYGLTDEEQRLMLEDLNPPPRDPGWDKP